MVCDVYEGLQRPGVRFSCPSWRGAHVRQERKRAGGRAGIFYSDDVDDAAHGDAVGGWLVTRATVPNFNRRSGSPLVKPENQTSGPTSKFWRRLVAGFINFSPNLR